MKKITVAGVLLAVHTGAFCASFQVNLLTVGPEGNSLVFDPMFLQVRPGDDVTFVPSDAAGHVSVSVFAPHGVEPWKGTMNTPLKVKIEKQGVYLVECETHMRMGMVAVIQAGKPANLAEAKMKAAEESEKMVRNRDRFAKLLEQVKQ